MTDPIDASVDIPIPPGEVPWALAVAVAGFLVDEWRAEVVEFRDQPDGTICIDLRVDCAGGNVERGERPGPNPTGN